MHADEHEHEHATVVVAPVEHAVEATGHVVEAVPGVDQAEHIAGHVADELEERAETHRLEETVEAAAETAEAALNAATVGQIHEHADLTDQIAELREVVERHVADDAHHRAEHEAEHQVEEVEAVEPVAEVRADREHEAEPEHEAETEHHEPEHHRERPRRRGFLRGRRR